MNEQLLKFIELCLTDGVISDKEREVIFRKAAEYNVDIDECEIILESMIQQKNMIKNIGNDSNTETQIRVPKFLLGGYKILISIDKEVEKPNTIQIDYEDEFFFNEVFYDALSRGFNRAIIFLNQLIPKDEFVTDLINKYSEGSENRKIKKYSNGDYYEGKIVNDKANGFGELNIVNNDLLFMKYTKYIGDFTNDIFIKGKVFCHDSDNEDYIIEFEDVEYNGKDFICRSIKYHLNYENFEGDVINFKRHGKGKLTTSDGNIIEGTWENDILIYDKSENNKVILQFKNNIEQLFYDLKHKEVLIEAEKAEIKFKDFFKDSIIANKYLISLMKEDLQKAYKEIDRITQITDDKTKIQHSVGLIYAKKGDENNDLNLLKKALQCFQSLVFSNKEFGISNINNLQEKINTLTIQNKLKSLGVNSDLIIKFTDNNYKKIWKASCLITEPYYDYKNTISRWENSNPIFFIPSNGIITEKGAIAFIKANWNDIYIYCVDKNWNKKGNKWDEFKSFDKTKFEIIEIEEIKID
jgi:hypothetical protein